MKSWNWPWEKMCKLEKGQSCVFCFSPSTAHFCISFVHPPLASWEPWNKDGLNPFAHQPDKRLLGGLILCPAHFSHPVNPHHAWSHTFRPQQLGVSLLTDHNRHRVHIRVERTASLPWFALGVDLEDLFLQCRFVCHFSFKKPSDVKWFLCSVFLVSTVLNTTGHFCCTVSSLAFLFRISSSF